MLNKAKSAYGGKRPDELNSREYLSKHLYEQARNGGYRKEFRVVKEHLPILKGIGTLKRLLEATRREQACDFKEEVVRELVRLYQERWDLRPASGLVILAVLWTRLIRRAPGGWLDEGIYWLLEEAQLVNVDEPDLIESLLEFVRRKVRGRKLERETTEELNETETTDYTD